MLKKHKEGFEMFTGKVYQGDLVFDFLSLETWYSIFIKSDLIFLRQMSLIVA